MTNDPTLIERIYEAAALRELWPAVLGDIAIRAGSKGAMFVAQNAGGTTWVSSPRMERDVADYFAAGWTMADIANGLIAARHPGFQTETDFLPVDQIHRLPVHADFFDPKGYVAGSGTIVQGTKDDLLLCILQGFASHGEARAAVPWLDTLRAPLARSLSLTARLLAAQAKTMVTSLDLAGVGAAVVSAEGRLRAANDRFTVRLGARLVDRPTGLRFADRLLHAQYEGALADLKVDGGARSLAVAATDDEPAFAMHLLPLLRGARDVFGWDGLLILLAEVANASVPETDLLRRMFDLTPTEATLTRHLLDGRPPADAARLMRVTDATARTHLRRIFAKTGVRRQAELVRLLLGLGGPDIE